MRVRHPRILRLHHVHHCWRWEDLIYYDVHPYVFGDLHNLFADSAYQHRKGLCDNVCHFQLLRHHRILGRHNLHAVSGCADHEDLNCLTNDYHLKNFCG